METTLLRFCLALPKVAFALRTCPPSHIKEATTAFDNAMREALSDLAGAPLSDWAWLKASLPSSLGGLTVRQASLHAPAAFLGSLAQTGPLAKAAGKPHWRSIEEVDVPLRQRALSHSIDQANYDALVTRAQDSRSRALALSTAIPHAGDWLNVVPSQALGLHLQDWEFRVSLQLLAGAADSR